MSTYEQLSRLSNERLADTRVYWPVDHIRDLTIDEIEMYYRAHITDDFTRPEGYDHFAHGLDPDAKRQYLKDIGVVAARYSLVMFAYFDDEKQVRGLPMHSDLESRSTRDYTGSYHNIIVDDYYDRRRTEYGQGSFAAAGGVDALGGETLLLEGADKPTTYLRLPIGKMLSYERRDVMAAMSVDIPTAKYVVLTKGLSQYTSFDNGVVEVIDE